MFEYIGSPALYVLAATSTSLVLALLALVPGLPRTLASSKLASTTSFLIVIALVVMVGRLPSVWYGGALDVDEAQMLAQAITLVAHPVPWKSYDPTTSGPLNSVILAIPRLVGVQPTYSTGRLVAAALIVAFLIFTFRIIRREYGELAARLSILAPTAFFAFDPAMNFEAYATEFLSITLIAAATDTGLGALLHGPRARTSGFFTCGFVLGLLPFAKLQATPFAIAILLALLIAARSLLGRGRLLGTAMALGAGLATFPLAMLTLLAAAGALHDFVVSYVVFPFYYVRENCCNWAGPGEFFGEPLYDAFLATCAAIAFASLVALAAAPSLGLAPAALGRLQRWLPAFFLGLLGVAVYAIEQPQTPFVHYLLLTVLPISGLSGSLLGLALLRFKDSRVVARRAIAVLLAAGVVCVALTPSLVLRSLQPGLYFGTAQINSIVPPDEIYAALRKHVQPGDRMAIWGWMPQYFIATGAILGTRDSISQFQIEPRAFRSYYRDRYMVDMRANKPRFFLDAVAPISFAYQDSENGGFESFPELRKLIDEDYSLVTEIDGIRLYERRGS